jgi:hypothetical protein
LQIFFALSRCDHDLLECRGDDTPQGPFYFFDGRILTPAGTPAPPPFAENVDYTTRRGRTFGARFSYHFGQK